MREICAKDTLTRALAEVPEDGEAKILLEPRVYEEKIFSEKRRLSLVGAGADRTVLLWHDPALTVLEDGFKRGTFRTYTAFFGGEQLFLKDLTIRNDAGDGRAAGQTVAAYLDSTCVYAENCVFDSHQDTLFLSPLPDEEREPRGFVGPREHTPRKGTKQYFKKCRIIGDVDFIFGGADAVFEDCEIICRDREHHAGFESEAGAPDFINGYVTAPCGKKDGMGLVFLGCRIHAEKGARPGSVYLGRPWRPEGKAAFLNCICDGSIAARRFSGWGAVDKEEPDAAFAEYLPVAADGAPIDLGGCNPWVKQLSDREADELKDRAEELIREILLRHQ